MDGFKDYTISGPPFTCHFSPVDQVTPPIYSRRILIFSRPDHDDDDSRSRTTEALRMGLQRTINKYPILAGQMGYNPSSGWTIKPGVARLRLKQVDMDFDTLKNSHFSESMLPADLVSSVPTLADPETEWHSCRIQANFIRGGLLVVISINHATMDGYGISKVIEALSQNCRTDEQQAPPCVTGSPFSEPLHWDRSILFPSKENGDVNKLDAYDIVQGPTNLSSIPSRIVTTTFRISSSSLKHLKAAASPAQGWITTHDAVSALCWRSHARTRYQTGMLTDEDVARFAFPVEFRNMLDPPLSADYIGNAVLMTKVDLPVKTLLGPDGLRLAAQTIRNGVRRVDRPYVDNFIAVASSTMGDSATAGQMKINLKLRDRHTAFGSTSYKSFNHSGLDWDPIVGRFERLRLASGVTGEGMSVILPVLRDGSWEVTLCLEEELELLLREDDEFIMYTNQDTKA